MIFAFGEVLKNIIMALGVLSGEEAKFAASEKAAPGAISGFLPVIRCNGQEKLLLAV
jgi:hypothetical protein